MDILLAVLMGVALAAACGFRVFVPLLVAAIGVRTGDIQVTESFAWVGSDATLVLLAVATALEILGYYVPWVDNALDTLATPLAVVAGTLVTASFIVEMSPMMRWSIAVIAGGGVAGVVQVATTSLRAVSTITTGGLANPIVSTAETAASTTIAILAIALPLVAGALIILVAYFLGRGVLRLRRRQSSLALPASTRVHGGTIHADMDAIIPVTARVIRPEVTH